MAISVGDLSISDGYRATYVASWAAFTPAASPTSVLSLTGSATKTLRLLRIGFSATQTTAGIINVQVNKLSSALTGGTPAAPTSIVAFDSTDPAATASAVTYTANTTGGGAVVGALKNAKITVPVVAVAGAGQNEFIFNFANNYSKDAIIRGTSQVVALTLLGVTLTGGSICTWIEWTEE